MQLKREAKLLTVIGLNTKHADCRIIFMFYFCIGFHVNMKWHNFAESLMDVCINKGVAQHQEAERMSDTLYFLIVLTDVNLKSDIFFRILSFSKSRNTVYKNNLYHSNKTICGVFRCI